MGNRGGPPFHFSLSRVALAVVDVVLAIQRSWEMRLRDIGVHRVIAGSIPFWMSVAWASNTMGVHSLHGAVSLLRRALCEIDAFPLLLFGSVPFGRDTPGLQAGCVTAKSGKRPSEGDPHAAGNVATAGGREVRSTPHPLHSTTVETYHWKTAASYQIITLQKGSTSAIPVCPHSHCWRPGQAREHAHLDRSRAVQQGKRL